MNTKTRIEQARRRVDQAAPDDHEQLYFDVLWADEPGQEHPDDGLILTWGDPELRTGVPMWRGNREMWDAL